MRHLSGGSRSWPYLPDFAGAVWVFYVQYRDHAGNWKSKLVGDDLAIAPRPMPSICRRPDIRAPDAVAPATPERGLQGHLH
jgi:hypothetical protein